MNETVAVEKKSFGERVKSFFRFVYEEGIKFPAYILVHPIKGFDIFKREKRGKMSIAIAFLLILCFVQILEAQYSGYIVNPRNVNEINSAMEISYIVVPLLVFTVANWSATSFLDGKGKMNEIFMMVCYSFFPLIFAKVFGIIVSNVIYQAETGLYVLVLGFGSFLMLYMVFFGLISIHEYGLLRCLASLLLTLLAVLIIAFTAVLAYDLFQKIYGFVYTIYREITLRYI
ncbi:MAG: YIP1 family protein [Bacilli bacterium]|jgi:hypothetical protein|nr:YIP1 family protein [Bacillota bacterium]